jgi:CBS domain-containing protein
MQVSDVMTRDVAVVSPYANVLQAAQKMDWLNVGALPVCDGDRLVGIVTDRDITVRCTAAGESPESARVHEVMTDDVCWCFDDDPVEQVEEEMAYLQIRRLPVVDHGKRLIGMVSLGDLVACRSPNVEGTLRAISEPSEPDRSGGPIPRQHPPSRSPWTGYAEAPHMAFAPLAGRYAED